MKMKHMKLFSVVMFTALIIAGCKKKDKDDNEEENITTVKVTLTPASGGSAQTYTWKDVDGPGGNAPSIDQITINAGSIPYTCSLQFLDESKSPAENKTTEVLSEAVDHQVYYEPNGATVTITSLNTDGNGLPLGTTSLWVNPAVSNGSIKITLKHKPGVKAAGDAVTKGETDVEVTFPLKIQ